MKKIKKIKERILSIVLTCAMMATLLVGIPPMEVKAANFYPPIMDTDSITLYESGCLKKIDITVQASGYYADAYGRIGVHNAQTSYDWNNRFIGAGCTNWPDESEFKAKDSTFLAFANGDQFMWTDQQEHRVTVEFDDGEVDLSQTGTYYIYLWTISDRYGIYTDALIGTVSTENGVLKDSNGNTLIDSSATAPETTLSIIINQNLPASVVAWEGRISKVLTVSATASDGSDLTYQWYERKRTGDVAISGATEASFTIPTDLSAGIYNYYCKITAGETQIDTDVAVVTIRPNNVMSLENWLVVDEITGSYTITLPENMTEYYVSTTADVDAMNEKIGSGVTSDNYLNITGWTKYTTDTTGVLADGETLVISTIDKTLPYDYGTGNEFGLNGVYGYKYTKPAVEAPTITGQPEDATVQAGETATFSVTATGTPEPTYQWYIDRNTGNFVILDGATNATYTTSAVDVSCNGFKYKCIVTNDGGNVESEVAVLTVTEPPHTHTVETTIDAKSATCTTAGNNKYYQCDCGKYFKDAECTTETTVEAETIAASHSWVTDAWEKDATNHWHKCNNCTEAKDKAAHVDANTDNKCDTCGYVKEVVVTAPVITKQPQNVSVKVDEKATFSVTATGDNLKYQWQINRNDGNGFVNISGATSASYVTSAVDMSCNGFKYQCIVSNEGGNVTTNTVTLTVVEKEPEKQPEKQPESPAVHVHALTQVAQKSATCTETGNKVYYRCLGCGSLFSDANGTSSTSLDAVTVKSLGHDMETATCTEAGKCKRSGCNYTEKALGHDWSGEWTVTEEATEAEDGKKETLCARDCEQKKVVIIPAIGTKDDNGNFEKDAEVEPEAPIDEATLNNLKEKLLEDGNIFTDAEKIQIENGINARVWLEITKTDESAIATTDKAEIEQEATKIMGDNLMITYFDADLFKQVGTNEKASISEPGIAIKITIKIPDELLNDDKTVLRDYVIIRLHESQVDVINGTFDATTGEFTFESDKFSTYAIVYKDVPVKDENPTPGDEDENPIPGDENENPIPGDENENPIPGDENENPIPGDEDENPTIEDEDDKTTSEDTNAMKPESNKKDEVPKTGESNTTVYLFMLMLLSGLGVIICSSKKKVLNKER